jgi:hypothetical protein
MAMENGPCLAIVLGDFPIETSIEFGDLLAMFDYHRVERTNNSAL